MRVNVWIGCACSQAFTSACLSLAWLLPTKRMGNSLEVSRSIFLRKGKRSMMQLPLAIDRDQFAFQSVR